MTRLQRLVGELERFYGLLPSPPSDPFGFFVWEILSAQTIPGRRDAALAGLKRIRAFTPDSLSRAAPAKLSAAVALAGPYLEQRLQALRTGADLFRRSPTLAAVIAGPLGPARRALKTLPRLGTMGARRMLLFAANRATLPADAPLTRVARRLGYGSPDDDRSSGSRPVQRALTKELPPDVDAFRSAFLYLSHHASATCTDSDPHCGVCPLSADCPEGHKRLGMGSVGA